MHHIESSVEVAVPVSYAYNQWTRFEEFPRFMSDVREVRQIDDTHLHWTVEMGGRTKSWDAEITDQVPDELIAWKSIDGQENQGSVRFHPTETGCQVELAMDYETEGFAEAVTDFLGHIKASVEGDLAEFKTLIEEQSPARYDIRDADTQGADSAGWRGEVHDGAVIATADEAAYANDPDAAVIENASHLPS